MAEDFHKASLRELSSQAANKAVKLIRESKEKELTSQCGDILLRIQKNDLADEVYGYCLLHPMHWQQIFDI